MATARTRRPAEDPPLCDLDMEQAFLGAVIADPAAADRGAGLLTREAFHFVAHQRVFDAIGALQQRSEPVDTFSVPAELRRRPAPGFPDQLEAVGGIPYINTLTNNAGLTANLTYYAGKLRELEQQRGLLALSQAVPGILQSADSTGAAFNEISRRFDRLQDQPNGNGKRVFSAAALLAEEMPEPIFTVPGILTEGLYLLVGRAKQGKSWLAYQLGLAIANGGMALGSIPVERGRVLYLALEDTKRRLKKRLVKLLGEEPVPELLEFATTWRRANDGGIAELEAYCRRHPDLKLIVIDVFGKFRPVREKSAAGIYLDDYSDISAIKEIADRYALTILVIHHQNKTRDLPDIADTFSGSTGLSGAVDGWLVLKRERGQSFAKLEIDGRDIEEPLELALEFDPQTIWRLAGKAADYIRTREEEEVIALLLPTNASTTAPQLAAALEISKDAAGKRLLRMNDRRLLVEDPRQRGAYSLSPTLILARTQKEQLRVPAVRGVSPVPAVPQVLVSECPSVRASCLKPDSGDTGDEGDNADSTDTKKRDFYSATWEIAAAAGFPAVLIGGGESVEAGEIAWGLFFSGASPALMGRARDALRRLEASE